MLSASDGSGLSRLTSDDTSIDDSSVWSPDGTKIAFESIGEGDDTDIYVVNAADGTGLTQLTSDGPSDDVDPVWSPDGIKIAFAGIRLPDIHTYTSSMLPTAVA